MNEKYIHLVMDGVHYYNMGNTKWLTVGHDDGQVEKGNDQWFISHSPLRLDGFYIEKTERDFAGWRLNKEGIPSYVNIPDDLPEFLPDIDAVAQVLLGAFGVTEFEDFEVYTQVYNSRVVRTDVVGEWVEAEGLPLGAKPPFKWRATFPNAVARYPEIQHLFECQIVWDTPTVKWFEAQVTPFVKRGDNLYTHNEISVYFHVNGRINSTIKMDYPLIKGKNLADLENNLYRWVDDFKRRVLNHVENAENKCAACDGHGVALMTDREDFATLRVQIRRLLDELRNNKNRSTISKIEHRVEELEKLGLAARAKAKVDE